MVSRTAAPHFEPDLPAFAVLLLRRWKRYVKMYNVLVMRMVLDIFAQIFRNLWVHKLRSFLTMFGIAWGVGSLLLLVGVGEGFRSGNRRELAEFGKDIMFIFPGRAPAVKGSMNSARSYLLTYRDYMDIRTIAPHVRNACPLISRTDLQRLANAAGGFGVGDKGMVR